MLFSEFYSEDASRYEDKKKFRQRFLKYVEDFVNVNFPETIRLKCRAKMGLDIERIPMPNMRRPDEQRYAVEKLLADRPIKDILDFAGVCYYALEPSKENLSSLSESLNLYIQQINEIFRDESMSYVMHDDGRIRFYPDEESHKLIKSTLVVLSDPRNKDNLELFNEVLDEFYSNHNKESPIHELFKCVEIFVLSLINNGKYKILNDSSVDVLNNVISTKVGSDTLYEAHDKDAFEGFRGMFKNWVSMCHKYRHGKADQVNNTVPVELFNCLFSSGVTIYRFLLQLDAKYQIRA